LSKIDPEALVAIARIVRPRGLKGELFAEVLTDFPDRFEGLTEVIIVPPKDNRTQLKIDDFRFQNERLVLKFAGIDSVEAAESLRDAEICIPESEAVSLEEDEFFDWQLEGCRVETVDGEFLGTVRELMRTGGTELLVVEGERELLIPFADAICPEVDIEKKLILVDPPEGLLEF
jgi:16S rRNA processing protein RimM